jgi:phosphoenolpyruvate-protein kinase (PTS system EI component)
VNAYYASARADSPQLKDCVSMLALLLASDIEKEHNTNQQTNAGILVRIENMLEEYQVFHQPLVAEELAANLSREEFTRIKKEAADEQWESFQEAAVTQGKMYEKLHRQLLDQKAQAGRKMDVLERRNNQLAQYAFDHKDEKVFVDYRIKQNNETIDILRSEQNKIESMLMMSTLYPAIISSISSGAVKSAEHLAERNMTAAQALYEQWRAFHQRAQVHLRTKGRDKDYMTLVEGERLIEDMLGHMHKTPAYDLDLPGSHDDIILLVDADVPVRAMQELPTQYNITGIASLDCTLAAHWAVLAAQAGITVVAGRGAPEGYYDADDMASPGDVIILESNIAEGASRIIIRPHESVEREFLLSERRQSLENEFYLRKILRDRMLMQEPVIGIYGNAAKPSDIANALSNGAGGEGLVRTEIALESHATQLLAFIQEAGKQGVGSPEAGVHRALFLEEYSKDMELYYKAFEGAQGPLTIRTFDMQRDKNSVILSAMPDDQQEIGFGFYKTEFGQQILIMQIAAILNSFYQHNSKNKKISLGVMFPMVSGGEDLRWLWQYIVPEAQQLALQYVMGRENLDAASRKMQDVNAIFKSVLWGAMVESRQAVENIDEIVQDPNINFISIGNNDLTASILSGVLDFTISRDDKHFGRLFFELMPSVVEAIEKIVQSVSAYNLKNANNVKTLGFCGAIAGTEKFVLYALFLSKTYNIPVYISISPDMIPVMHHFSGHATDDDLSFFRSKPGFHTEQRAVQAVGDIYAKIRNSPEYVKEVTSRVGQDARLFGLPQVPGGNSLYKQKTAQAISSAA